MSEYIFVHLIDKRPVGAELGRHLPLHMTAVHWFENDCQVNKIIDEAEIAVSSLHSIVTNVTEEDFFGPKNDIPVMRLDRKPELVDLHLSLMNAMQIVGAKFDERWTGAMNWNPHVTHQTENKLYIGDSIHIEDVDLITRRTHNASRKIIRRFNLND